MYAESLANYINGQNIEGLRVWTSWLKRTIQTVAEIKAPQERWKALNEIDAVNITFYCFYNLKCTFMIALLERARLVI